jgi:hypothetical protein
MLRYTDLSIFENNCGVAELHSGYPAIIQSRVISLSEKHEKSRFRRPLFSTPYLQLPLMAPQRRPLGTISGNKIKKQELTPYKRGQIIGAAITGTDNPIIATALNTLESTVQSTLRYDLHRLNGETVRRTGRPRTWNDQGGTLLHKPHNLLR